MAFGLSQHVLYTTGPLAVPVILTNYLEHKIELSLRVGHEEFLTRAPNRVNSNYRDMLAAAV